MMQLENKIALITGGSKGIGKSISIILGRIGIKIIATSRSESGIKKINQYFLKEKIKGISFILDVSNNNNIRNIVNILKKGFGMPNILINNAGIISDNLFLLLNKNKWENVINVNLTGPYNIIKSFLKPMIKKGWGRIINISSVVAVSGNYGQSNYVASKAGLIGFSKTLSLELARNKITVNVVAPGFISTDMINNLSYEKKQQIINNIPLKRMGQPEEVAYLVNFLISNESEYITGQTIHINGGIYLV